MVCDCIAHSPPTFDRGGIAIGRFQENVLAQIAEKWLEGRFCRRDIGSRGEGDEAMSEEEGKQKTAEEKVGEESKGCEECLNVRYPLRKFSGGALLGIVFLMLFTVWCFVYGLTTSNAPWWFTWGVAVMFVGASGVYFSLNIVGRHLYVFYDQSGRIHIHAKMPPYVVTSAIVSGATKDFFDCNYYYIPRSVGGSQEDLFSKFGITRPILRIPDGGWFGRGAVLCSGNVKYHKWNIDRAAMRNGQLTTRLYFNDRDDTAIIVSPEDAIAVIEKCSEKIGTQSIVCSLLGAVAWYSALAGGASMDAKNYEDAVKKWKKYAVDGWSRVNALYEVLMRLEKALAASKSVSKSKIVADARVAVEQILESELMRSGDDAEPAENDSKEFKQAVRNAFDKLVVEFDVAISNKDVPMLKKAVVAPSVAKAPLAPTAQQA